MAPREIQDQTEMVMRCLFQPETSRRPQFRVCAKEIESDSLGASSADERFDPVIIADHLREIGDQLDEEKLQPLVDCLVGNIQSAAKEKVSEAFSNAVEVASKTWIDGSNECQTEFCLLKGATAVGLYVQKQHPQLMQHVQTIVTGFIVTRLGDWLDRTGGWGAVFG